MAGRPLTLATGLRASIILSLVLAVAVYVGITAYGDFSRLGAALTSFRWTLVPAILALTLFNYLVRFVKWEYYLRLIGARPSAGSGQAPSAGSGRTAVSVRGELVESQAGDAGLQPSPDRRLSLADSLNIYWAGLFMVITPAKVGEWIKSYFLRQATGTPVGRSAPIVVAERLTDGLALALLALLGLASVRQGWAWVLAFLALAAALVLALRYRPLALLLLRLLKRAPLLRGYADFLD
ncbi:MAG: flippase-like domain-containing protein, partial [Chloroflexi bacterium]|nr:flippase-like domain-containing protein [Chloroflexota bacterium]